MVPQARYKLVVFLTVVTRAEFVPVVVTASPVLWMLLESKQGSDSSPEGFSGIQGVKVVTFRKKEEKNQPKQNWARAVILCTMEQLTEYKKALLYSLFSEKNLTFSDS